MNLNYNKKSMNRSSSFIHEELLINDDDNICDSLKQFEWVQWDGAWNND